MQNACPRGLRRKNQKCRIITGHCNSLLLRFLPAPFALAHNCKTHGFNLPWQKYNLQFFVNSLHELWTSSLCKAQHVEAHHFPLRFAHLRAHGGSFEAFMMLEEIDSTKEDKQYHEDETSRGLAGHRGPKSVTRATSWEHTCEHAFGFFTRNFPTACRP